MNLIEKYNELVLNTKPSPRWQKIRFAIHWITLPIKLALIGGLGITQIILKSIFTKKRPVANIKIDLYLQKDLKRIMQTLPVLKGYESELYVNRVRVTEVPNGHNHNTDHQCSRQGTYVFLKRKLGLNVDEAENSLAMHMWRKWLKRGFKQNPVGETVDNIQNTSGDMLIGLCLGMLDSTHPGLRDGYYELIHSIIDNDFALLAHDIPDKNEPGYDMYMRKYEACGENPNLVDMKSYKGRWEPGLDIVGAQALTLLAALRIGDKVVGAQDAKKMYQVVLKKYGYGLLSLFPTAYIDSKRGYFNDHNCMVALYILSKLADTKFEKFIFKFAMRYVHALSRHWYNGYFTGLLEDAYPGTVSQEYINKCKAYLYEEAPRTWGYDNGSVQQVEKLEPVKFNQIAEDEFAPDCGLNKSVVSGNQVRTGLGFMAHAILLEKDPKKLL